MKQIDDVSGAIAASEANHHVGEDLLGWRSLKVPGASHSGVNIKGPC